MRKHIFIISLFTICLSGLSAQERTTADDSQLIENLTNHLEFLCADELLGRKAGTPEGKKAAEYVFKQYEEIGVNPKMEPFRNGKLQNVVSEIPSKNGKYILLGAHYDHIGHAGKNVYNGADDNASGTATLIEVARILNEKRDELSYGVIFVAFDGEEEGLYGSKYNASVIDESKISLMISIDMVGHLCHEGRLIYEGTGTFENGEQIIRNALIDNVSARTYPQAVSNGVLTDTLYYDKKGIPALNLLTGEETSNYHQFNDDIETLDIPGMALIARHLAKLVQTLPAEITPTHVSLYEDKNFRFGASLGLINLVDSFYTDKTETLSDGLSVGLFSFIPIGTSILGNLFLKPEFDLSFSSYKDDTDLVTITKYSAPLSVVLTQKVFGLEMMYPLGIYYAYQKDSAKNNSQEIGIKFGMEFKTYNNLSFINHISLGLYMSNTLFYITKSENNKIKNSSTIDCLLSMYF